LAAFGDTVGHQIATYLDGPIELFFGHRSFVQKVACASGYLAVDDTIDTCQIVIHTHVNNTKFKTMLAAKHIYAATAMGKVYHLLPGYAAWRHTYALALYAVIATQKQVARVGETWL
jgi:hypothetical protein